MSETLFGVASLSVPIPARVIEIHPDGSGVVEVPILSSGQSIDLSRTAGGGAARWDVTAGDLTEMALNIARHPSPIPIGRTPHKPDRAGPSEGFLEGLEIRGSILWGRIKAAAALMSELVADEWRGFSGEFARNAKLPTVTLPGWAVFGGIFTNQPASENHFRFVAAGMTADSCLSVYLEFRPPADKEQPMETDLSVKLATAEASVEAKTKQLETARDAITTKEGEIKTRDERIVRLEAEIDTARRLESDAKQAKDRIASDLEEAKRKTADLESTLADERKKRVALENQETTHEVRRIYRAAIARGVAPVTFPGFAEADKLGTLLEAYNRTFRSLEAFKDFSESAPATASMSSLRTHKATQDDVDTIDDARKQRLARLGLDPDYVGVTTAEQAREIAKTKTAAK